MTNYLEYSKQILTKMSFCPKLLNKEYRKCNKYLTNSEQKVLRRWIKAQQFASQLSLQKRLDL